jgi:serine/threonine protein kinase
MKKERWQEIERILEAASELEPVQREAFLRQACRSDEDLRREVEELLEARGRAESSSERPTEGPAERSPVREVSRDSLVGRILGTYEVVERIGVGGMGEVYRARDQKLRREVALKVLPAEFAADVERMKRFEREARMLAALNHPSIAAIYGLEQWEGKQVLVMELVKGDTLAERLRKGPMEVKEVLRIAIQMAEALEAAH